MTVDEAADVTLEALFFASQNDTSTGGDMLGNFAKYSHPIFFTIFRF